MDYHPVQLNLSRPQMLKLSKGKSIRMTHQALKGGPHHVLVTIDQLKKIMSRRKNGKGMDLTITKSALQGSGFFSSIGKALKHATKAVGNTVKKALPTLKKGAVYGWDHKKEIVDGVKLAIDVGKMMGGHCNMGAKRGNGVYVPGGGAIRKGKLKKKMTVKQAKAENLKKLLSLIR
jgi:hypothetical protein